MRHCLTAVLMRRNRHFGTAAKEAGERSVRNSVPDVLSLGVVIQFGSGRKEKEKNFLCNSLFVR